MKTGTALHVALLLLAVPIALAFLPISAHAQGDSGARRMVRVRPPPPKGLGYQLVRVVQETPSGRPVTFSLNCPDGKYVVSGGVSHTNLMPKAHFHIINSAPDFTFVRGQPEGSPTKWVFTVMNDTTPSVIVSLYFSVVCVNPS